MRYCLPLLLVLILACAEKRELQLPDIENAKITNLQDVSAAYLFYDEIQPDSVLLNRKNLISTTNWLINIDKRLTLEQAIPHIKFLQDKKKNSSHKNEKAKNYFTCHDLSKNDLGFLEFTEVNYHLDLYDLYERKGIPISSPKHESLINVINPDSIRIHYPEHDNINYTDEIVSNRKNIFKDLSKTRDTTDIVIYLSFLSSLTVQDYISIQSSIKNSNIEGIEISNHEFIIDSM